MLSLDDYTHISLSRLRNYFSYPLPASLWACFIKIFWDFATTHTHIQFTICLAIIDQKVCLSVRYSGYKGILETVLNLKRLF